MRLARAIPFATRLCESLPKPIILVPTMGALHVGHVALLKRARALAGRRGSVVASIFVNPTQFGPHEDFTRYPRTFRSDQLLCAEEGVDLLFHPKAEAMYPRDYSTYVNEELVSNTLCGRTRPGHFRGVCTVVLKLFQVTCADAAVFGLKDFQQCAVIQRMVRDLNLPVKIVTVETVREPDGLALSSRNRYLNPAERAQATVLRQGLTAAGEAFASGETRPDRLRKAAMKVIAAAPLARVDYIEVADAESLRPVTRAHAGCVLAGAVFFGTTRLIDNLVLR